jgi:hypothetical protein
MNPDPFYMFMFFTLIYFSIVIYRWLRTESRESQSKEYGNSHPQRKA